MDRKQRKPHSTLSKCLGGKSQEVKLPPEEMRNEVMTILRKTQPGSKADMARVKRQRRLMYLLSEYPCDLYMFTKITKMQIKSVVNGYLDYCFDGKRNFVQKALEKVHHEEWRKVCDEITNRVCTIQEYAGEGGALDKEWRENQQYVVYLLSKNSNAVYQLDSDMKKNIKLMVGGYLNYCFGTQRSGSYW